MDTNHQQQRSSRGGDRSVFKCATLVVQWRVWLAGSQVNTQSVAVLHLHIPCGGVHFNNLSVRLMISSMYRQQVLIGTHYMDCIVTTSAEITTWTWQMRMQWRHCLRFKFAHWIAKLFAILCPSPVKELYSYVIHGNSESYEYIGHTWVNQQCNLC